MISNLQELIADQAADDASDFVDYNKPRPDRAVAVEPSKLIGMADDIQAKKEAGSKISWGQPAKIAACRDSHSCGSCKSRSATYNDGNTALVSGVDFTEDKGEIVGACCDCGFSFAFKQALEEEDK